MEALAMWVLVASMAAFFKAMRLANDKIVMAAMPKPKKKFYGIM